MTEVSLPYSDCCSEQFSTAASHLDFTCSLVIELLNSALVITLRMIGFFMFMESRYRGVARLNIMSKQTYFEKER